MRWPADPLLNTQLLKPRETQTPWAFLLPIHNYMCIMHNVMDLRPPPRQGWIHEIRKALMMTTTQLAERLGVHQTTISRLERSEAESRITLGKLEKAANALDCELRYIIVPKQKQEVNNNNENIAQ